MVIDPIVFAIVAVYTVAITAMFAYMFMEQAGQRKRRKTQKPQCTNDPWCGYRKNPLCSACRPDARRPRTKVVDLHSSDAEILAVAAEGLDAAPELADDAEAVARTVLALEEVAALRQLARADGEEAAFVTPGCPNADAVLAVHFPRAKTAPKEKP